MKDLSQASSMRGVKKGARPATDKRSVAFDPSSRSAMAQTNRQDDVKHKVQAVREVITERNKNDIHLVLQHYEYDVPATIQAFIEGGAEEALGEWKLSGPKTGPKKRRKSKSKAKDAEINGNVLPVNHQESRDDKPAPSTDVTDEVSRDVKIDHTGQCTTQPVHNGDVIHNLITATGSHTTPQSPHSTGTTKYNDNPAESKHSATEPATHEVNHVKPTLNQSSDQTITQSETESAHVLSYKTKPAEKQTEIETNNNENEKEKTKSNRVATIIQTHCTEPTRPNTLEAPTSKQRDRTTSETTGVNHSSDHKPHPPHRGLDKSAKDLQRQISSLIRLKSILLEECHKSQKFISTSFEQARNKLQDREVAMIVAMEKLQIEAVETLTARQKQAADLKLRTDRVSTMSELEFLELRLDIKHFVSDRKVDEDLACSTKYECDIESLLTQLQTFGSVLPLKNNYSTRRPSISSLSLSSSASSLPPTPLTPPTPMTTPPSSTVSSTSFTALNPVVVPTVTMNPPLVHNLSGAKVVSQSASLTAFENTGRHLALSKTRDLSRSSSTRRSTTPAGGAPSAARGHRVHENRDQRQSSADSKPSREDNKKSRNARRRQKQKERVREYNGSRKASDASVEPPSAEKQEQIPPQKRVTKITFKTTTSKTKDAHKTEQPDNPNTIKVNSHPKPESSNEVKVNSRGGRTHSPTKRFQQKTPDDVPNSDSEKEAKSTKDDKGHVKVNSKPLSPRVFSRGRGGQRSRSRVDTNMNNRTEDNKSSDMNKQTDQHTTSMAGSKSSTQVDKSIDNTTRHRQNTNTKTTTSVTPKLNSNINNRPPKPVQFANTNPRNETKTEKIALAEHDKKTILKAEFRYNDPSDLDMSDNSSDPKKEAKKMLNGDISRDLHIKDNNSIESNITMVSNGGVTSDKNNSNSVHIQDPIDDAKPQRKQRSNRSASRKLPKCDVIIGQSPAKNGVVEFDDVEQHRWSNEDE